MSVVLCVNLIDRRRSRRNTAGAGLSLVRYTHSKSHRALEHLTFDEIEMKININEFSAGYIT